MNRTHIAALSVLFLVFALCGAGCRALAPPIKWNVAQIEWQTYDAGITRAQAERKPICLVFYADWCEPCKVYSHVFEDPRVIERARDFVMIRVNAEERPDLDRKFRVDGNYIPRTYFLTADGTVLKGIHATRGNSWYIYDGHNPASLLGGMEAARKLVLSDPKVFPGEDPSALTPAELCTPEVGDATCAACLKARCCEASVVCRNQSACSCRFTCQAMHCSASMIARCGPEGTAYRSEVACIQAHCGKECSEVAQ